MKKKNESLPLQDVINKFNERLIEHNKNGYTKKVKDNLILAVEFRDGCIEAFHDPKCYDKEDIKKEIIEFTKIIIQLNNIAQAHFNPTIKMPSVEEQLKDGMKTDPDLMKIFGSKKKK